MIKNRKIFGIVIALVIVGVLIFINPIMFKKNHIERIAKLELPKAAKIVEDKFYADLYGLQLKYAKVEITQEIYDSMQISVVYTLPGFVQTVVENQAYDTLDLDNADEIKCSEIMESKISIVGGATTRVTYCIAVKADTGKYYIYIISS